MGLLHRDGVGRQMTFVTFPAFKQLVQTRTRFVRPDMSARIDTRFGSQRRLECLLAWLTL